MFRVLFLLTFLTLPGFAEDPPAEEPQPKTDKPAAAAPTQPAPPIQWPQPTPNPFPFASQGGGASGGGGGGSMPTPVIQPPPPAPVPSGGGGGGKAPEKFFLAERPKVEPEHPRPRLFITRGDRNNRTIPMVGVRPEEVIGAHRNPREGEISELLITLETFKAESENDLLIASHDYENDQILVDVNHRLHAQTEELYRKRVIPLQTYEESLTKLHRSEAKLEESRARVMEYQAEVQVNDLKVREAKGETISNLTHALAYLALWEGRLEKTRAAVKASRKVFDYETLSYNMAKKLHEKGAESLDRLIKAERNWRESEVVWKLATALEKKNEANVEKAREDVKRAGAQEARKP